jgi:mannose-1-phosphate guanylyltransferase
LKALILTGGLGTRLRPLTYSRPKHLLPVANVPHIEHVFDLLQRHGVDEIVLLTSFLAEAFEISVERAAQRGLTVAVAHEVEPLGTAGALKNAQELVGNETFLAFNGDVLTDVDLSGMVDWHRERGAEATIVLTPVDDPSAYGVVPTEPDGHVLGFIEKPPPGEAPTNLINAGVYVCEPTLLDRIPEGRVFSAERELFPAVVEDGTVYARGTDAYWMDIGTPANYLQANLDALAGRYVCSAVAHPDEGMALLAAGAEFHESARVSSSCLGSGSRVEADATVERSVLLSGASVGEGATIRDAVLGERVKIGRGVAIEATAIGDDEIVDEEK